MKPKIIFVNGWGFDNCIFDNLRQEMMVLLPKDYDEIFINPTSISDNDLSQSSFSMLQDSTDKFVICWSLGTAFFMENIDHFTNIKGLVFISSTLCFLKSEDYKLGWDKKILLRMSNKLNSKPYDVMKDFARNSSSGYCSYYHYKHIRSSLIKYDDKDVSMLGTRLVELAQSSSDYFKLIKTKDFSNLKPLIIHGEYDNIINVKNGIYMYNLIPQSRMIILENCGHIPHVTHSRHVACLIYNYFKDMELNHD